MEGTENKGVIYEFEGFVLDPNERTLTVDGVSTHLPAKEFDTLLYLVENSGRALTKEEMLSAIWQDAFVEEVNLAKQISRLRKVLNNDQTELIQTIPKHGYRFKVSDLRRREPDPLEPVIVEKRTVNRLRVAYRDDTADKILPPAPTELFWKGGWRRTVLISACLLLIAAAGAAFYFRYSTPLKGPETVSAVKSVAVLPFRTVAAEKGDEQLRFGLTDALTTKLSSLKHVIVRPTNAVLKYETYGPLAAGRELGVDAILEGNVQQTEQQIRVTVQLVSVADGRVLWGGKFDEKFTDLLTVQDTISEHVARALELGLTSDDRALLAKHYTTNPDAHYSYVRGRFSWNKRTVKDLNEAIAHFNDAIAKDPNYALAYAGLADSYSLLADYRGGPSIELYDRANAAALKALALDDTLAEAHTSLAYANMYGFWNWQAAESGYQRAIKLNPNYATAHQWYSEYLSAMGRFDEALTEIRRAKEIDPLSSVINAGEVWILYFARRYDEAIDHGRKLTELNPEFTEVSEYLKRCYGQKGLYREAIAARQRRRKLAGVDATETPALKRAANAASHEEYWKSRLEQEIDDARNEPPALFDMAEIYAQLGDKDKAFEWLEKAFEERNYLMMYLRVAPNLDPLRSDPRFDDLLRRVGLAQ